MKAIILDMYGVIVKQTGDDFVPYVQNIFPDLSQDEIRMPWFKADVGELSSLDVWRILGFKGNLEQVEKEYLDTIELNEGFYEFVASAKKQYKLAIISNDSSRWSKYIREKFQINQYFDVISISGDLKIQKPDSRIFELTLEKLELKAEDCVYVDDRRSYLGAARKVGMDTVLFNSRGVEYDGKTVMNFYELEKMFKV
ncbi:MAG: HAD family hydrolase [Lachnospiraceae bacterium]|nr:HAD family hydrolase [Lachnospiraceae bacterium]